MWHAALRTRNCGSIRITWIIRFVTGRQSHLPNELSCSWQLSNACVCVRVSVCVCVCVRYLINLARASAVRHDFILSQFRAPKLGSASADVYVLISLKMAKTTKQKTTGWTIENNTLFRTQTHTPHTHNARLETLIGTGNHARRALSEWQATILLCFVASSALPLRPLRALLAICLFAFTLCHFVLPAFWRVSHKETQNVTGKRRRRNVFYRLNWIWIEITLQIWSGV